MRPSPLSPKRTLIAWGLLLAGVALFSFWPGLLIPAFLIYVIYGITVIARIDRRTEEQKQEDFYEAAHAKMAMYIATHPEQYETVPSETVPSRGLPSDEWLTALGTAQWCAASLRREPTVQDVLEAEPSLDENMVQEVLNWTRERNALHWPGDGDDK